MAQGRGSSNPSVDDDPDFDPNGFHNFHTAKRGPRGVPETVRRSKKALPRTPKDPGYSNASPQHISLEFFNQQKTNAPFGYEHFVSLPPAYNDNSSQSWPLILFLHGAGQSQRQEHQSFFTVRHGIPKAILCYDQWRSYPEEQNPSISIPIDEKLMRSTGEGMPGDTSSESMPAEVCRLVAENFITVTPSLNMTRGYGWSAPILSALLDEILESYRIDVDRIHVTGFSMGGYGTWSLGMYAPTRFASLMPVCGGGDRLRAGEIAHLSQWVHHGELDHLIPVAASRQMVNALQKAGAPHIKYSEHSNMSHDIWHLVYKDIEVYKWMLATRRDTKDKESTLSMKDTKSSDAMV